MEIKASQVGDAVVLSVMGRMDAENAGIFEDTCDSWISNGTKSLVVDLQDLAYVSSMGLRSFINVGQKLDKRGGKLRLCRLSGLVRQVFQITHLYSVFSIYDTVDGALAEA